MKKHFVSLILLLLFTQVVFAQAKKTTSSGFNLNLSPEMKEPSNSTIHDFLGEDENYSYVVRTRTTGMSVFAKQEVIIESYDKKLALHEQKELDIQVNGDKAYYSNTVFIGGNLYAYFMAIDKESEETDLYYQPIDNKTLALTGTPKKILSVPYDKKKDQASFRYDISKDKSKIAIIGVKHSEKDQNEQYTVNVFDGDMNKLWNKDVTLPYDSKLFTTEDILLDNNGNLYARGRLYNEVVKEKKKGMPNYTYKILAYRDNGKNFKEYSINLKDKFITDLGFQVTDGGNLAVAGFYSDRGTTTIKGVTFMLIDASSEEVLKQGTKDFDASFLSLFTRGSVSKKKDDPELYEYDLDNIIIRSDGGALLLAEQFYVQVVTSTHTINGVTTTTTTYYYHYNDVIAININPDLTVAWATRIPKRQTTANDGGYYSSYAYAVKNDKIYLLFNDDPDNIGINDPKSVADYTSPKKSAATLVTIGSDGKWKKSLLFSNKEEGVILRPKVCEQSSADQMFIYAEKGKNYVIGRVDL